MISTDFIDICQRLSFVTSLLTLGRTSKFVPPSWYKAGGRGVDGTPPQSSWYVAVFWNDFAFSGKPLIFLTRWGIFFGWWRCWRPVTSPIRVTTLPPSWILPRIRNQVKGKGKRFRLVSEQKNLRDGIFGFDRARNETRAFCRAVFDSCSWFFTAKPHRNPCYAGYSISQTALSLFTYTNMKFLSFLTQRLSFCSTNVKV